MPSEHSRSSSGSSVTSPIPTINLQPAPALNGNGPTISLSNTPIRSSHPELLEIFNARTGQSNRDRSTSRDRNTRDRNPRGKSPSRNNNNPLGEKRGKSPSGRSKSPSGENLLDRPKSQDRSRSRSPGPKSPKSPGGNHREKSPRSNHSRGNSDALLRSSSQDARLGLTSKTLQPWIAPSGSNNGGSSSKNLNRLSLPPNFADISIATIRENNERFARLNLGSISDKDNKSSIGSFSRSSSLRSSSLNRPKLSVSVEALNSSFGGSPLQRTPSGQGHRSAGGSNLSPLLVPGGVPLTRSRSYNSVMDNVHRSSAFTKEKPHPLQHSWTMYYDSKPATTPGPKTPTLKLSYEENLQTIGTFNTVETFCRYFNWVKKPSQLDLNTNFHIFKDKIKPMWEDPANANGGKWVISMRNPQLLDRCWTWLVYSLVGEELDEGDDICGAVMSRRIRGDRIAVWVRDKDNVSVINGIGRRLLRILDLQNEKGIGMDFQFNEDALKSGTSYNNRVYLSLESLKQELENAEKARKEAEEKEKSGESEEAKNEGSESIEITPHIITVDVDIDGDANAQHTTDHDSHVDGHEHHGDHQDNDVSEDNYFKQETTDCTPKDQFD